MTPKEKASQLVQDYLLILSWVVEPHRLQKSAELCASRAVDEIIKTYSVVNDISLYIAFDKDLKFWQEVKKEIEQL